MPGYIYRDELLEHLAPLLELLDIKPEALVTLRVNPRGIELDYRNLPPDPFAPLEFRFWHITDRDVLPVPDAAEDPDEGDDITDDTPTTDPLADERRTEYAVDQVAARQERAGREN